MLMNLTGLTLIFIVLIVLALAGLIAYYSVLIARRRRNDPIRQERDAYEAGVRQAKLQRAYEDGLKSQQSGTPEP